MGIISEAVKALVGARGQAISATVPVGTEGIAQAPVWSYERFSREGYGQNELVYACVEQLATSAGEARLCAYVGGEKTDDHPLLDLWNAPNPFMDGLTLASTIVMYRAVAGNAYVEKVRSGAGKLRELWLPRPDRVFVVPDRTRFVRGYQYVIGAETYEWPAEDVIHIRTRNPLADQASEFYGLPPLYVAAGRVDADNNARQFVSAFFTNAGVPAGLLTTVKMLNETEREMVRSRFSQQYGGPKGWHRLLVIDGNQATYAPMGMPLGTSGAGMSDLDEMSEARICMAFGVPPSIVATRLGMHSSSYTNRSADKENFWELTLVPLYREIAGDLTLGFRADYPEIDYLAFDTDSVRALQEDADKLSTRVIGQLAAGVVTQREARLKLGYPEEPEESEPIYLLPANISPTPGDQLVAPPLPEPMPDEGEEEGAYRELTAPTPNGRNGNGRA